MLKPKDVAARLGVSVKTLQRWDKAGIFPAARNPQGRRYYTEEQVLAYLGKIQKPQRLHVAYARVSSAGQKGDLASQVAFLRDYVNAKGVILDDVFTDVGSGLNYKRKNWNHLIFDLILQGQAETVYITFKDRFVRFGFDWFEELANRYGCEIVVVNNPDTSPQQELVEDLISIIHVFSCRVYGLRKYKKQVEHDPQLTCEASTGGERSESV
ncbi:IS607 family transposase [Bifidobacterium gallicum]|uniref:Inosine-5`-monophosphate dehydrogenase n=1 Tax=Bifidobacterium gallicum DSM 20093 = LMG 11596 TaxID=561180 RepID=D1NX56_9BIFI|nr:IS607 family transposase [Bifidobacterium gallicum]EFA22035.1 transcriptional regulator, MerR family [Bifidobacterium gallicum DSM 20093 = LMG 11596]KFI57850.1 inosine-5`-monophosphate dehydrogenase [Bifidobacterium gallicum DSM 20093 = LMG 11596]